MTEEKTIEFKGVITLEDKIAREQLSMIWTKVETMNDRTKSHTMDIQGLRRKLKLLEKEIEKLKK